MQFELGSNSSICQNAGPDEKIVLVPEAYLPVLFAACAGNQQWSKEYFSNIS